MTDGFITDRISWAEENLSRQIEWVERHDTRCATILSISIAMLGFLAAETPPIGKIDASGFFFSLLAIATLSISLLAIYFSSYPRTSSPNKSLVYFGTISSHSLENFSSDFCQRSDKEHLDDLCAQTHINSHIVAKKFAALKVSLIFLLLSVPPWIIAALFLHWEST